MYCPREYTLIAIFYRLHPPPLDKGKSKDDELILVMVIFPQNRGYRSGGGSQEIEIVRDGGPYHGPPGSNMGRDDFLV